MQYAWLIWSFLFLAVWFIVYIFYKQGRKEMLYVSLATMPFGLTEPLFVPAYWNPPSLFNLAQRTGFDIESLIFTFAIGGIGSVIYKIILKKKSALMNDMEKKHKRHKYHLYILLTPVPVFLFLALFTSLNHIYCGIISMFVGAVASLYCRPDLKAKIWLGGLLFLLYYLIFFLSLIALYPGYVELVWNLKVLSGLLPLGVPLEEWLFAITFGMLWSSFYEHIMWYKVI